MTENKKLSRWTTGLLISDVLVTFWDMGIATYNFIQGRWIAGIFVVATAGLVVWSASGLLKAKHDTERMRLRHEYMTKVLEDMNSRMEYIDEED